MSRWGRDLRSKQRGRRRGRLDLRTGLADRNRQILGIAIDLGALKTAIESGARRESGAI